MRPSATTTRPVVGRSTRSTNPNWSVSFLRSNRRGMLGMRNLTRRLDFVSPRRCSDPLIDVCAPKDSPLQPGVAYCADEWSFKRHATSRQQHSRDAPPMYNEPGSSLKPAALVGGEKGAVTGELAAAGSAMGAYAPLHAWLVAQPVNINYVPATFEEIESILGFPLPPTARQRPQW